jgi:exosome complex component CSL4
MKGKIVMPGEILSTSEELFPGEGTFEENGYIKAAIFGRYIINKTYRRAEVKPITSVPVTLKRGDIVIAKILSARASMVTAEVIHVVGKNRAVSGDTNATIRVSEISSSYVREASTEYGIGDFVKARVIQVKPSLQLATKGRNLGVIKALCGRCRHPLFRKDNSLECKNCGCVYRRKISMDYGNLDLNKL